jgi:hypothetical protein
MIILHLTPDLKSMLTQAFRNADLMPNNNTAQFNASVREINLLDFDMHDYVKEDFDKQRTGADWRISKPQFSFLYVLVDLFCKSQFVQEPFGQLRSPTGSSIGPEALASHLRSGTTFVADAKPILSKLQSFKAIQDNLAKLNNSIF